jgi:hypothetical protein
MLANSGWVQRCVDSPGICGLRAQAGCRGCSSTAGLTCSGADAELQPARLARLALLLLLLPGQQQRLRLWPLLPPRWLQRCPQGGCGPKPAPPGPAAARLLARPLGRCLPPPLGGQADGQDVQDVVAPLPLDELVRLLEACGCGGPGRALQGAHQPLFWRPQAACSGVPHTQCPCGRPGCWQEHAAHPGRVCGVPGWTQPLNQPGGVTCRSARTARVRPHSPPPR